jgi:VWFA-related protein
MVGSPRRWFFSLVPCPALAVACLALPCLATAAPQDPVEREQRPVFKAGVDLVSVSATVTDGRGHFVAGLTKEDFTVREDGREVPIAQFSSARVPVSLGIVLDSSDSMSGERMAQARRALEELLERLHDREDEVCLFAFDEEPRLLHGWTTDREAIRRALRGVDPTGRTALYDAVSQAVAYVGTGRHRKKAVLVISDGNDTASRVAVPAVKRQIQESELLIYAIGVDAHRTLFREPAPEWSAQRRPTQRPRPPIRIPIPIPGSPRGPGGRGPIPFPPAPPRGNLPPVDDEPVDSGSLRSLTDDSGGRTEIVRSTKDLGPATSGIADELNRQYYLAYVSAAEPDGQWHVIEVLVRDPEHRVRARRGFLATK